jgi:hypothetical protein
MAHTGKHGHAKLSITAIEIASGRKARGSPVLAL